MKSPETMAEYLTRRKGYRSGKFYNTTRMRGYLPHSYLEFFDDIDKLAELFWNF